jgi:hypothetical protein
MIEANGDKNVEELWSFLRGESPRCLAIVGAAFFDETLGRLLGDKEERSLYVRIDDAFRWGLLSPDERHDLHVIRKLRNDFAHNLRDNSFERGRSAKVNSLRTWQRIFGTWPTLDKPCPDAASRLLYVIGVIGFRLQKREKPSMAPRPEPDIWDTGEWPPITSGNWG